MIICEDPGPVFDGWPILDWILSLGRQDPAKGSCETMVAERMLGILVFKSTEEKGGEAMLLSTAISIIGTAAVTIAVEVAKEMGNGGVEISAGLHG